MHYVNLPIFVHSLIRPRIGSIPWTATCYYLMHQRKCGGNKVRVKLSILQRLVFFKVSRISPPFWTSLPASCLMSGSLVLLGGVTLRISNRSHLHSFLTLFFPLLNNWTVSEDYVPAGAVNDILCCYSHLQQKPSQRQPSNGLVSESWRSTYLLRDQAEL